MSKFQDAMKFILPHEGGYSFDPTDPGGETNFGIAKRSHPTVDIKNLTIDQAMDIYYREYWITNNIESYDSPFCVAVMDSYVQHGPSKVRCMLDVAVTDLQALLEARRQYYLKLIAFKPELGKFKNGWLNRINDLSKYCAILVGP